MNSLQRLNNAFTDPNNQLIALKNTFPKIIQTQIDLIAPNAFHQTCKFLCEKLKEIFQAKLRVSYYEFSRGQALNGGLCAPFWKCRLLISLNHKVQIQVVPPQGVIDEGGLKKIKKAVTINFSWYPKSLKECSFSWSVLIKSIKPKSTSKCLQGIENLKKLYEISPGQNLAELPTVYPCQRFYASQKWYLGCLADAHNKGFLYSDPFHKFKINISRQVVLNAMINVGDALAQINRKGLAHSDVKLENMLLNEEGEGILTDFDNFSSIEMETATSFYIYWPAIHNFKKIITPFTDVYGFVISLGEIFLGKNFFSLVRGCNESQTYLTEEDFKGFLAANYLFQNICCKLESNNSADPWFMSDVNTNYCYLLMQLISNNHKLLKIFERSTPSGLENSQKTQEEKLKIWDQLVGEHQILTMDDVLNYTKKYLLSNFS